MKIKIQMFIIPVLMMIIGCQSAPTDSARISDGELIQLIRESSKVDISIDELPNQSITVIENDMEYEGIGAKIASDLGYEVDLAGRGHKCGDRNEIYFNLEGRKLDPNEWGRKGRGWSRDGWDTDDWVRDGGDKKDWKCFDLVLPVTFNMPDGSTITVTTDNEDSWSEIKDWYEQNPGVKEKPTLQFPVEISFEETTATINNDEELRGAYRRCDGRDDKWVCFEIVYPVTYIMPDGSTITVTSDDEDGWAELKDWYEYNSDSEERPSIQYPVDILIRTEDGETTVTINNQEEMDAAKEECRGEWNDDDTEDECFDLLLPVTYLMPDGTTITIEDERGWYDLRNWYEENDGVEGEALLQYPVDILIRTEDGETTVTINNQEEMEAAEEECRE